MGQDVQRFERQVEGAGGALGRMGGLLGSLGGIGLAAGGIDAIVSGFRGAIGAVGGLVTQASDLNEQLSRSEQIFGAAAESVQRFARESAQGLGIARAQALQAAGNFGQLLRTSGLTQDAAAEMSTRLVRLAADLASFNNIDPSEALDKLRAGLTGEAEPLRELGVLLSEDAVQAEALASGLVTSTREITEAVKVQARFNLILKQTATAQGDFARTSTGLANAQRIIRASWADLSATLGQAFLPMVARAASFLATEMPRAIALVEQALTRLGPVLAAVFSGDLQGALDQALVLVAAVGERLGPVLATWTARFWDWVQEVTPRLLEGLQGLAGDVWAWIREQAPTFLENLVGTWTPAFLRWVRDTVPPLLVELGRLLGEIGKWVLTTAVPQLQALGHDMGVALAEGLKTALVTAVPRALAEGVSVPIGSINVNVGAALNPVETARQVGAQVAAQVLASLTASAAVTDPGAAATQQGAR